MLDLIHKVLHTGIGFAVLTEEKAREIVSELEKKGDVSKEEGKKLAQELIDKSKTQAEEFKQSVKDEVNKIANKVGWISREEFNALQNRLAHLEAKQEAEETVEQQEGS